MHLVFFFAEYLCFIRGETADSTLRKGYRGGVFCWGISGSDFVAEFHALDDCFSENTFAKALS